MTPVFYQAVAYIFLSNHHCRPELKSMGMSTRALAELRQEDNEFQASLGSLYTSCLLLQEKSFLAISSQLRNVKLE